MKDLRASRGGALAAVRELLAEAGDGLVPVQTRHVQLDGAACHGTAQSFAHHLGDTRGPWGLE